ncbi:MAG: hypothetical protein AB7P21_02840 [Lautropia sp.]
MHQVSFPRLAIAGALVLGLAACGSEGSDPTAAADAGLASGATLKGTGLQRGDDIGDQGVLAAGHGSASAPIATTASASASGSASTAAAVRARGLTRGDDPATAGSASGAGFASPAAVSFQENAAVGASSVAATPAASAAPAPSPAPASPMSAGDAPAGAGTVATAASAPTNDGSFTMQRGDDVAAAAGTPAPAANGPAASPAPAPAPAPSPSPSPSPVAANAGGSTAAPVVTTAAAPTAPPVSYRRKVPMSGPVVVPAGFTGIHTHFWPGASAAPTYGYGTVRSLNYYGDNTSLGILWYGINTADGVYDWSKMDNWVSTHHNAGKQIIYTLYGTPAWCSSNLGIKDLYNRAGGDSKPSSLTCVQKFVDALVRRYNGDGVRRIQKFEIWNEPNFQGYAYWRNTAADLAAVGRTVYQTAKAVDPGIQVLWPAFVEWYSAPSVWADNVEYANASDGAGGIGKQWADGFSFHFYAYNTGMDDLMDNQESAIRTLAAIGKSNWDRHNSEMGFGDGYGPTLSASVKATTIKRWMALSAAYGNKVAALYAHDSEHIGYPASTPEISAAIDEVNRMLPGKTIREAGVLQDGRVFVVFGDNTTWLI